MEIVDKEILPKQGVNNRKRPVFTIKKKWFVNRTRN